MKYIKHIVKKNILTYTHARTHAATMTCIYALSILICLIHYYPASPVVILHDIEFTSTISYITHYTLWVKYAHIDEVLMLCFLK